MSKISLLNRTGRYSFLATSILFKQHVERTCRLGLAVVLTLTAASSAPAVTPLQTFTPLTQLVSINSGGTDSGNGGSFGRLISADGRFVAFNSFASDLVPTGNSAIHNDNVFVRDLQARQTMLVSINVDGTGSGNNNSDALDRDAMSPDGRFVVFESYASDLVANDTNGHSDVFMRNLQTGITTLVSVNRLGTGSGNGGSFLPVISANGRFVAFVSYATDLVENETYHSGEVFVRDLQTGTTTLVTVNRLGTGTALSPLGFCTESFPCITSPPYISGDGRFVLFQSEVSDLVANDTNGTSDIFVRDLQAGTTSLVSINRFGTDSGNGGSFWDPIGSGNALSADGRYVTFESNASDLVSASDNNGVRQDVFVRDLQAGTTSLVSINRFGTGTGDSESKAPAISANGRFVAFFSEANDLVANDPERVLLPNGDVFVRDLQVGTTTLVSINRFGTSSGNNGPSLASAAAPAISADGRFVAFMDNARDLVSNDTNGIADVFVRDLQTGTTTLMSVNRTGMNGGNGGSAINDPPTPVISADGRFVAFDSFASDLVANDTNGTLDVFVRPVVAAPDSTPPLITPHIAGTLGSNGWYRSNVTVSWTVVDPESGIASSSGCTATTLTADTPGTTLTCSATNGARLSMSVPVVVKIDKTPPVISGLPAPVCTLWPPNHKMVQVATVTAGDGGSGLVSFNVSGRSNEASVPGEVDVAITGTVLQSRVVQLREERSGTGTGRIYTLTAIAGDQAGNTTTSTATCTVPHDQGKK